jgi:multiple antibiotic resistance protein
MESRDWFNDVLLAFLAILPVVNPFSKPPIFLSITEGWTLEERRSEAFKSCIYAFIILFVSLIAGTFILEFFSISLPALQIAGGLLIARTGFQMLNPQKEHHQTPAEEHDAKQRESIAFVPLAMPLLSGPGSMAVMINLGVNGMNALTKLMGFLLLALAIQFMINGATTTLEHLLAADKHPA